VMANLPEGFSLRAAAEALLLAASAPLTAATVAEALGLEPPAAEELLRRLADEYRREGRGYEVQEVAGGFRLTTRPELAPLIQSVIRRDQTAGLSHAALETLAVVAYRQPVTRAQIEQIRGVNSEWVLGVLLERDLICEVGRAQTLGRPILYGTTHRFLEHFGLRSLEDLPPLELEGGVPSSESAHPPRPERES